MIFILGKGSFQKSVGGLDPLFEVSSKDISLELYSKNKVKIKYMEEIPNDYYLDFEGVVTREEDFGAVILDKNGRSLFVNVDGYNLIEQCVQKVLVSTNAQVITENKEFFLRLLNSNIVSLTPSHKEQRYDCT